MILKELLASTPIYEIVGLRKIDILGITVDPQDVQEGYLYVYLPEETSLPFGEAVDEAVRRGALAICIDAEHEIPSCSITCIKTYHVHRFLAAVARNFFQNPSQGLNLTGVTGSHGKTTVGWMVKSILKASGIHSLMMGMSFFQMGDEAGGEYPDSFQSISIHTKLREALDKGIRWGMIECSYTGIVEEKLRHIRFDSLIYTDLYTHFQNQKADYHFFEIRKNLLDYLKLSTSPIIVNMDDYYAHELKRSTTVGYGIFYREGITAEDIQLFRDHSIFVLKTPKGSCAVRLAVPGIHHIYNAMAAAAWGLSENFSLQDIQRGLESFTEIPEEYQEQPIRDNIHVSILKHHDLSQLLGKLAEHQQDQPGKICIILQLGEHEVAQYKDLVERLTEITPLIFTTVDYKHSYHVVHELMEEAPGLVNDHDEDNFKALQKAVNAAEEQGRIYILL